MFTHLGDFKSVLWNVSVDCLQCNNKVNGVKFSLKIAHNLETCFQTQLFESHK